MSFEFSDSDSDIPEEFEEDEEFDIIRGDSEQIKTELGDLSDSLFIDSQEFVDSQDSDFSPESQESLQENKIRNMKYYYNWLNIDRWLNEKNFQVDQKEFNTKAPHFLELLKWKLNDLENWPQKYFFHKDKDATQKFRLYIDLILHRSIPQRKFVQNPFLSKDKSQELEYPSIEEVKNRIQKVEEIISIVEELDCNFEQDCKDDINSILVDLLKNIDKVASLSESLLIEQLVDLITDKIKKAKPGRKSNASDTDISEEGDKELFDDTKFTDDASDKELSDSELSDSELSDSELSDSEDLISQPGFIFPEGKEGKENIWSSIEEQVENFNNQIRKFEAKIGTFVTSQQEKQNQEQIQAIRQAQNDFKRVLLPTNFLEDPNLTSKVHEIQLQALESSLARALNIYVWCDPKDGKSCVEISNIFKQHNERNLRPSSYRERELNEIYLTMEILFGTLEGTINSNDLDFTLQNIHRLKNIVSQCRELSSNNSNNREIFKKCIDGTLVFISNFRKEIKNSVERGTLSSTLEPVMLNLLELFKKFIKNRSYRL